MSRPWRRRRKSALIRDIDAPGAAKLNAAHRALARRGTAMDKSQIRTLGRLRRHALVTSFAAMLIVAGGIGHALAEDDEDDLPDAKFFKSIMRGLGMKQD